MYIYIYIYIDIERERDRYRSSMYDDPCFLFRGELFPRTKASPPRESRTVFSHARCQRLVDYGG